MTYRLIKILISCALFLFVFCVKSTTPPAAAQGPEVRGPFTSPPLRATSFDGDVRKLPQSKPPQARVLPRPLSAPVEIPLAPRQDDFVDPVRQARNAPIAMPLPIQNFKGLGRQTFNGPWPPDTNGDVGPNHYIQTVNTAIGIYNKTGTQLAAFTYNSFFSGAGITGTLCDSNNIGDPVVLYDAMADRWVITDFAFAFVGGYFAPPYYECIAVSKTSDPVSGGWWLYAFLAHNTLLNDYPKWGVWPDAYYMSANMFDSSEDFQGVRVWAFNRTAMLSGTLTEVHFDLSASYMSLLPSNLRGSLPPSGTPNFFLAARYAYSATDLSLWRFHVDWTTPSNSTFTGPTSLTVPTYSYPPFNIPQFGTSQTLDAIPLWLMMQLQYRNIGGTESLWANHTIQSGTVTGIRWYEIRSPNSTPTVYQAGTFQPDSNYRWMASLAVDHVGNMAVGYSVSSSSMYPGIRYAGRLASDPLGTLGQGETTLFAGTGSQTNTLRWGDYSAMTVDPTDDCTFWYTTEYYEATGNNWQTRIGSFKFPSCTSAPPIPSKIYLPLVKKDPPSGWSDVVNTDFEDDFPGSWVNASINNYAWGQRSCRPHSGTRSGWAVGGGLSGSGTDCGSNYPDDIDVWMIYGPFSLENATNADMGYKLWLDSELVNDKVCHLASTNGNMFYGTCLSGDSAGWVDQSLDLTNVPTLGNLLGQPNVWVALAFMSNGSVNEPEGAFVDNVVVRKCPTGESCPSGSAPSLKPNVLETPVKKQRPKR